MYAKLHKQGILQKPLLATVANLSLGDGRIFEIFDRCLKNRVDVLFFQNVNDSIRYPVDIGKLTIAELVVVLSFISLLIG